MDDNEYIQVDPVVPREVLVKQGISAITYLSGGIFLLIMVIGAGRGFLGIFLSGVALIVGIGALASRDQTDKKPGLVLLAAGVLGMMMRFRVPLLQPIAATILTIGGLGLFAAGIWKGIRFLLGLKSRR